MRCALALALALFAGAGAAEQVLRAGNGVEPESLDPHRSESTASGNVVNDLYEGLTGVSPRGEVVAGAATHWDVGADGLTYDFHLRPAARWSNGDAVTADDFVAAWRRAIDPATGSAYAQLFLPVAGAEEILAGRAPPEALGVTAVEPHRLQVRLKAPTHYFLGLTSFRMTFPLHRPSLAQHGRQFARAGRLVGNGAYRLDEWVLNSHVSLVRNPHYWNDRATQIDRVIYVPTEDANAELKRYLAGELDITYQVPLVQAPRLRRERGSELRVAPLLGLYYYGLNLTRPPFQGNPKLRAALALAIDREVIVEKAMRGMALPAYGWVPPGVTGHAPQRPEWAAWPAPQRLALARQLYAEAGYSAQRPAAFELRYNTHEDHRRIAVVIAAMWKQALGARVKLVNEEWKVFMHNVALKRVTQVFRDRWIGDYDDASTFLDILHSRSGVNAQGFADEAYDALVERAAAEGDAARRADLLAQAERRIFAEWPAIPIYFYVSKHLVKPYVAGWQDNVLDLHSTKDLRLLPR